MKALFRRNLFWVALGAVFAGGLLSSNGVRDFVSRQREIRQLDGKLRETQERLARKQALYARAQKDDEFLEAEARRLLGLVKPDEVEFRFVSHEDIKSIPSKGGREK